MYLLLNHYKPNVPQTLYNLHDKRTKTFQPSVKYQTVQFKMGSEYGYLQMTVCTVFQAIDSLVLISQRLS